MSPDGSRVFVTGESSDGYAATTALDSATGIQQWNTVTTVDLGYVIGRRLAVSSDGARLFMTGVEQSSGQSMDFITAAFDAANGSQLWATPFDSPAHYNDSATLIAVAPDGATVYVTGPSGRQSVTIAYNAATGGQLWSRAYNSHEPGSDTALGIAVDADGVFVTGASPSATSNDAVTVAYDPVTGARRWLSRYDGAAGGADQGSAVVADPTGHRLFVVGSTTPTSGGTEYLTLAYATAS
jgi:outer membrane protein assembly factor BamB